MAVQKKKDYKRGEKVEKNVSQKRKSPVKKEKEAN